MEKRLKDWLIYTNEQERCFREKYAVQIQAGWLPYQEWFLASFPAYEWNPIYLKPGQEEFTVGLLCLLMRAGLIQFGIRQGPRCLEIQREVLPGQSHG